MEQLFEILNLVIPTIILALFALHYQLRKKTEIRIETELANQRIQAYEALYTSFVQIMRTETPTLKQQIEIDQLREHYGFQDFGSDYSIVLATEADFDDFFQQAQQAVTFNSVLLDYDTLHQAQSSMGILSQIKSILDAFCDATCMHLKGTQEPRNTKMKIDYAYLLASVMLKNLYNRTFLELEDTISHQMSNIEVVPGKRYFKRAHKWIVEQIMFVILLGSKLRFKPLAKQCERFNWIMMGRTNRNLCLQLQQFYLLLGYVYVSDRYSFQQYLHLPAKKADEIRLEFNMRMGMQMHTRWTNA